MQTISGNAVADLEASELERPADLSWAGHLLLLPVAVFVVALVTIDFSHLSNFITAVWAPNALILVALLRPVPKLWRGGAILAGGACALVLANWVSGNPLTYSTMLGAANIAEVVIAWTLLAAFHIDAANLTSFRNLLFFIVLGGVVAPLGGNTIAAMMVGSLHAIDWHVVWLNSYPAHALGMILVVPFLVSIVSREWTMARVERRLWEAVAIAALVVSIGVCAAYFRTFIFIIVPVLLLATVRFGMVGATAATFVASIIFTSFMVMGIGEPLLTQTELWQRISALQILIAFASLWSLPVAALLTERDRLLSNLSAANAQLKVESERKSHMVIGLHRHLTTAEEKERLRLSHELHDQAGQSLIAAILELREIDPLIEGAALQRLHLVRERMEEMGKTLHRIAWELRPPAIGELGLCKALASYIEDWGEQCDTEVDFHCEDPSIDRVPNEIGSAVYRVVQEALTNVVKHAQKPSSVSVVLRQANATLQMIIEDNGCGFDVGAMAAPAGHNRGLGLDGMRERLLLIGGTLEIESTIGTGTTIFARIPLDEQRPRA